MYKTVPLAAFALTCLVSVAAAQTVGQQAPELSSPPTWVLNPPPSHKLADYRGEVVVIEHWGTR